MKAVSFHDGSQPRTMLAARIYAWRKPLRIDEIPVPEIGDDEVLVQTVASAITSSTVRMVSPRAQGLGRAEDRSFPYVIAGHPAGQIVQMGSAVRGFRHAERVLLVAQAGCKVCTNCRTDREHICLRKFRPEEGADPRTARAPRQGGMAGFFKGHYRDLVSFPDEVSFAQASEVGPLACAYRAVKRSGLRPGESIIVSGATGNYGLKTVLVALALGAGLVIAMGRNVGRLESIKRLATARIETVATPEESIEDRVRDLTDGWGAHRLVDYLSATPDVTSAAVRGLRPGGRAVLSGEGSRLDISYSHIQQYAIEITGSSGATYHDYPEVLELIRRGLISFSGVELRPFPLDTISEAVELMADLPGSQLFWCHTSF